MLLREYRDFTAAQAEVLTESNPEKPGEKSLYMKGIFMQAGLKNHNGRVYPLNEIRNAVDEMQESLKKDISIFGEADHPEELTINIKSVSHMITEVHMDGNNGVGKLKILPTPTGNIVRAILESGGKLGVSTRGSGNVDENGNVSSFELVTVDLVCRPSAPDAYPSVVYEQRNRSIMDLVNRSKKGQIITELAEAVQHDKQAQKYLKKELLEVINNLRGA